MFQDKQLRHESNAAKSIIKVCLQEVTCITRRKSFKNILTGEVGNVSACDCFIKRKANASYDEGQRERTNLVDEKAK